MFGIGFPELVVIFVVLLVLFGPDKLPELARTIGKLSGELKKNSDALRREFYNSVYTPVRDVEGALRKEMNEAKKNLTTMTSDSAPTTQSTTLPPNDQPKNEGSK